MKFDWNPAKAAANVRKHDVSFEEAEEAVREFFALTGPDYGHSSLEDRERTLGRSGKGRILVVITTRRPPLIRLISARKATAGEVKHYEKAVEERLRGRR